MAWVAAGEDRKVIKDLAASGSLDPVTIPAEKMVIDKFRGCYFRLSGARWLSAN